LQLLVREEVGDDGANVETRWFLLNTKENRAWVAALANGEVDVAATPLVSEQPEEPGPRNLAPETRHPFQVIVERPSIFALYEQNIGLLTPILAEQLQDAERRYPVEWIELAFSEAVSNNKRSWRYIERILERWAAEGKQSGKNRGPDGRSIDPDKYTKGKYAFLFKPEQ
jgi:DnaD/phage-associated family protein